MQCMVNWNNYLEATSGGLDVLSLFSFNRVLGKEFPCFPPFLRLAHLHPDVWWYSVLLKGVLQDIISVAMDRSSKVINWERGYFVNFGNQVGQICVTSSQGIVLSDYSWTRSYCWSIALWQVRFIVGGKHIYPTVALNGFGNDF